MPVYEKNKDLFKIAFTHSSLNKKDNQGNKINYEPDENFDLIINCEKEKKGG